ncbi:MAG: ABC transporter ATP-binding protein, partial [Gemmatimonadales bacterium]
MIRADAVSKTFRLGRETRTAVRDVSLHVNRDTSFGLVGESGSGKSTVAMLLAGLEQPDTGTVTVAGIDWTSDTRGQAAKLRRRVQIVLQDVSDVLNPRMRIGRAVAEVAAAHGAGRTEADAAAYRTLESVGMATELFDRFPHSLSGGQKQRVSLARALVTDPEVLILDEPVASLDFAIQAQVLQLLGDIKDRGEITLVVISHDLRVIRYLCDGVAVMQGGTIVETGA